MVLTPAQQLNTVNLVYQQKKYLIFEKICADKISIPALNVSAPAYFFTISTRRFLALPSSERLSAIGFS